MHTKKLMLGLILITFVAMMVIFVPILTAQDPYDDGRINQGPHLGNAVVYCRNSGIEVYDWKASQQVFFASETEILAVSAKPDAPVEIKSQGGYSLYRLPGGEFQLNGPDELGNIWAFIWKECQPVITVSRSQSAVGGSSGGEEFKPPRLDIPTPGP